MAMASDYVAVTMDSNADGPPTSGWVVTMGPRVRRGIVAACLVGLAGCSMSQTSDVTPDRGAPPENVSRLDGLFGFDVPLLGDDRWEVVLCQIPREIDNDTYDPTDERLVVTSEQIVTAIEPISDYFDRWSGGRYTMSFMPAKAVAIAANEDASTCVEAALDASSNDSTGVIVVADAPHRVDVPGGWAQPGVGCATSSVRCSARQSRRAVYVGAADFFPIMSNEEVDSVALDLLEHEIGHAFGWPHSSHDSSFQFTDATPPQEYNSAIDIMSNSAAPRLTDSRRRHGPGVLAFNRLSAGWLAPGDVAVANSEQLVAQTFTLSAGGVNQRNDEGHPVMVVLELSDTSAVTIEIVANNEDNDHLSRSAMAVHVVQWGDQVCPVPRAGGYCIGVDRRVTLVGASADGLLDVGQLVTVGEVTVALRAMQGAGSNKTAEVAIWRQ